jgi:hypothetical protein
MESAAVNPNDTVLATQYDSLRRDAVGGSFLSPHQQASPNMTIFIENGVYYIGAVQVKYAGGSSPSMTAPVSHPRIDLVCIDSAGTVTIITGSENISPTPPTYPTDGRLVICEITHTVAEVSIKTVTDGVNGYISADVRKIIHGNGISRFRGRATLGFGINAASVSQFDPMNFDTVDFDDASNFDAFQITSTNTTATLNKLVDSTANFTAAYVGRIVYNSANKKYARISAIDSTTQVSLSAISDGADIFVGVGNTYTIFGNRFTAKLAGYYQFNFRVTCQTPADTELVQAFVYKNGSLYDENYLEAPSAGSFVLQYSDIIKLAANDYLEFLFGFADATRVVKTTFNSVTVALIGT